eukprot:403348805
MYQNKVIIPSELTAKLNNQCVLGIAAALQTVNGVEKPMDPWDNTQLEEICKNSKAAYPYQSPINIDSPFVLQDPQVEFNYEQFKGQVSLYNNGGNNLKIVGNFGSIQLSGKSIYNTNQIIFHSPSEHSFGSEFKRYPLEMQIVHQDRNKNKAIVSVFFEEGDDDSIFLRNIGFDRATNNQIGDMLNKLSDNEELSIEKSIIDLTNLVNNPEEYVMYEGSLTEPNCDSNVQWILLTQTISASKRQLEKFPQKLRELHRSTQPRLQRQINLIINNQENQEQSLEVQSQQEVEQMSGVVVNHPNGLNIPSIAKKSVQQSEITRLSNIKQGINQQDKVENKNNQQGANSVIDDSTNSLAEETTFEEEDIVQSNADKLFDDIMNDFFSDDLKSQKKSLIQKNLASQNRPRNLAQLSSKQLSQSSSFLVENLNKINAQTKHVDQTIILSDGLKKDAILEQFDQQNTKNQFQIPSQSTLGEDISSKVLETVEQVNPKDLQVGRAANKSLESVIGQFNLDYEQDPQRMTYSQFFSGVDINNLMVPKLVGFDQYHQQTMNKSQSQHQAANSKTIQNLADGIAKDIATQKSNAFEIKFNDVHIEKSVNQTIKQIDGALSVKDDTFRHDIHDRVLNQTLKLDNLKTMVDQINIKETVNNGGLDEFYEQQIQINQDKNHQVIDEMINKFDTKKFVNQNYRHKDFDNEGLVKSQSLQDVLKEDILLKQLDLQSKAGDQLESALEQSDQLSLDNLHDEELKSINNFLASNNQHKYKHAIEKIRDEALATQNKPIINSIQGLVTQYKNLSETSIKDESVNDYKEFQEEQLSVTKNIADQAAKHIDQQKLVNSHNQAKIKVQTNFDELYKRGSQFKQGLLKSLNNSTNESVLSQSFQNEIRQQLQRDVWYEGKWDDKPVIEDRAQLINQIMDELRPQLQLKSQLSSKLQAKQNSEIKIPSSAKFLNQISQEQLQLDKNLCKVGVNQSPINIKSKFESEEIGYELQSLLKDKADGNVQLIRNIDSGMIFIKGSWGKVLLGDKQYQMYGMYIHHPSEHTVIQLDILIQFIVWRKPNEIRYGSLITILQFNIRKHSKDFFAL